MSPIERIVHLLRTKKHALVLGWLGKHYLYANSVNTISTIKFLM